MATLPRLTAGWICAPQQRLFHVFPAGAMCSLRRALLLWLVPLFLLVGAGSGAVAYWNYTRMMNRLMDRQMQELGDTLAASGQVTNVSSANSERVRASGAYLTQVYDRAGRLVAGSGPALDAAARTPTGFVDWAAQDTRWRAYTSAPGVDGKRVRVLQSGAFRLQQAAHGALAAIVPVLILLPLAILVLWGVARAMSSAVQDIGRQAALQDAHTIAELPLDRVPQELQPLVVSFNSLLTRLRDACAEQRRFVQDAAHELRTPITALALQMENVRGDLPPGACAQSFAQLESGVKRAQRLVEQMLKLSRQQDPVVEPAVALDVRAQVHDSIASLIALADQRCIDLGMVDLTDQRSAATWQCVPGDLRSALDNLIENAVRYTPAGGIVDVRLLGDADTVVVEIVDSGPGIPAALLERVFDRFYRVPGGDARGSGLGLAIAQAAAQRCGMRLHLRNRRDRSGLVARLEPLHATAVSLTVGSESSQAQLVRAAYIAGAVRPGARAQPALQSTLDAATVRLRASQAVRQGSISRGEAC
jgi:two-component system, OmpR family, sensor kinase